jgi:hypothetical protein
MIPIPMCSLSAAYRKHGTLRPNSVYADKLYYTPERTGAHLCWGVVTIVTAEDSDANCPTRYSSAQHRSGTRGFLKSR